MIVPEHFRCHINKILKFFTIFSKEEVFATFIPEIIYLQFEAADVIFFNNKYVFYFNFIFDKTKKKNCLV